MNVQNIAAHLMENCTTVGVRFLDSQSSSSKLYTYKTLETFEVGDHAVVQVNNQFKIVRIERVDTLLDLHDHVSYSYKWIVQKVDTTEYNRVNEAEKKFVDFILNSYKEAHKKEMKKTLKKTFGISSDNLKEEINKLNNL